MNEKCKRRLSELKDIDLFIASFLLVLVHLAIHVNHTVTEICLVYDDI